jgi:hypothetical protein
MAASAASAASSVSAAAAAAAPPPPPPPAPAATVDDARAATRLGLSLRAALGNMVERGTLDKRAARAVWKSFKKEMARCVDDGAAALECRADAWVREYRGIEGAWSFQCRHATFNLYGGVMLSVKKLKVASVSDDRSSSKLTEPRSYRKKGGGRR